jgi:hypothetical protein
VHGPLENIVGSAVPAFVVTAVRGRVGVRDLARRSLRWRVRPHWYLIALLAPPAALLVSVIAVYGLGPLRTLAQNWPLCPSRSCRRWSSWSSSTASPRLHRIPVRPAARPARAAQPKSLSLSPKHGSRGEVLGMPGVFGKSVQLLGGFCVGCASEHITLPKSILNHITNRRGGS